MAQQDIAAALQRVRSFFERKPALAVHDDAPATARWSGGLRVVAEHADGPQVATDMPTELGGSGDQVTPGWLFRAGVATCASASILMAAAARGIPLTALDVKVTSRSDVRGLLGMADAGGEPFYAGPGDMQLHVSLRAPGVDEAALRALVESAVRQSPIPSAVTHATALALQLEVG